MDAIMPVCAVANKLAFRIEMRRAGPDEPDGCAERRVEPCAMLSRSSSRTKERCPAMLGDYHEALARQVANLRPIMHHADWLYRRQTIGTLPCARVPVID
jgi:hypothetical protein